MKTILSTLFIAALLASCSGSDSKPGTSAAAGRAIDSTSFTSVEWIDSALNLGKVMEGAQVEVIWRFRNTGNKPLVIEKAQAGCGCTVAEKPEAPVAPGAEGRIRATFNSEGRPGTQHKNVMVQANTKPNTLHELTFDVEVGTQ
ncbi:MAG: DUF1573 domain-containing protein [Chitinophagaceae bacterium]|nr:MAG: DUF1573 domain-containing protein [Chitinophagaceae bacterium]